MKQSRFKLAGFTLIELMIAVVVVAILAAIAVPAYDEQVRKTRRATAKAELQGTAQALERFNTVNRVYTADAGDPSAEPPVPGSNAALCDKELDFYTISCDSITAISFTLHAVPTGPQATDRCGTLVLNQAGVRSVVDAREGVVAADCW